MTVSEKTKLSKIGMIGLNKFGSPMEVIDFIDWSTVYVKFAKGNVVKTDWSSFRSGSVMNVYDKSVQGVGYLGEGEYKAYIDGVQSPQYKIWIHMFERCYSKSKHEKSPSYIGCTVNPVWHNFQNFAMWYDFRYYEIEGEKMCLDKDILVKGNKQYSPANCVFVPDRLNKLFIKSDRTRGDLPIGVTFDKARGKYTSKFRFEGKTHNLGRFTTIEEAFLAYKEAKEQYIKEVAEKYKHHIPIKLYEALLRYEVDIND